MIDYIHSILIDNFPKKFTDFNLGDSSIEFRYLGIKVRLSITDDQTYKCLKLSIKLCSKKTAPNWYRIPYLDFTELEFLVPHCLKPILLEIENHLEIFRYVNKLYLLIERYSIQFDPFTKDCVQIHFHLSTSFSIHITEAKVYTNYYGHRSENLKELSPLELIHYINDEYDCVEILHDKLHYMG